MLVHSLIKSLKNLRTSIAYVNSFTLALPILWDGLPLLLKYFIIGLFYRQSYDRSDPEASRGARDL